MPDRRKWTADDIAPWWPDLAPTHRPLLADACNAFDVSPDPGAVPRELNAVKGYGNRDYYDDPRVVLVTAGGRKLTWPIDRDTEHLLRYQVFHAYTVDRRGGGIDQELPLPADLALPRPQATGIPPRPMGGSLSLFR
mgnify:CR=1 FL=1